MNVSMGNYYRTNAANNGNLKDGDHGVQYYIDQTLRGTLVIVVWAGKSDKPVMNYRLRDAAHGVELVARAEANAKARIERKAERKAERAQNSAKMKEQIQVGTLLAYSWGYDQTNVEFYQVVEKKGVTVTLRAIKGAHIEGTAGHMCCKASPLKDQFMGNSEPFKKRIGPYGISMAHGSANPTSEDAQHYSSWYA